MSLSHHGKASRVAVPLLALHACDDPIADSAAFAPMLALGNPNLWFRITRTGGHLGFCEGWRPKRWSFVSRTVFEFCDAVLGERERIA